MTEKNKIRYLKVTFGPTIVFGIRIPFTQKIRYYSRECSHIEWMEAMAVMRAEFGNNPKIKMESY